MGVWAKNQLRFENFETFFAFSYENLNIKLIYILFFILSSWTLVILYISGKNTIFYNNFFGFGGGWEFSSPSKSAYVIYTLQIYTWIKTLKDSLPRVCLKIYLKLPVKFPETFRPFFNIVKRLRVEYVFMCICT